MKVAELIVALQEMDPDDVVIASDGGYLGDDAEVTGVGPTLHFGKWVVRIETL